MHHIPWHWWWCCHWWWCRNRGWCRNRWGCRDWCWCSRHRWSWGRTLHRQITSSGHVRSIHQVAHVGIVVGWWQWGAGSVHVWLHCLRVVQSIACSVHRCAIWQVAYGIDEVSTGQRRTRSVWIWSNGLRMVDGVASPVHWRAVRQVACMHNAHLYWEDLAEVSIWKMFVLKAGISSGTVISMRIALCLYKLFGMFSYMFFMFLHLKVNQWHHLICFYYSPVVAPVHALNFFLGQFGIGVQRKLQVPNV